MLIATPYENGTICQHFGKAPQFKIYTLDKGNVVESVVVDTVGAGHEAITKFLQGHRIDVVLVGGIGQPALLALSMIGIHVIAGVSGNPDEVVAALLNGTLFPTENVGGCGCGGSCGCGCGGHEEAEPSDASDCGWNPDGSPSGTC